MALDLNRLQDHLTLTGDLHSLLTAASQTASDAGVRFPNLRGGLMGKGLGSEAEQILKDASKGAAEGELTRLGFATLSAVNDLKAIALAGFAVLAIGIVVLTIRIAQITDTFANATTATLEQLTNDARVRWVRQLEAKMDEMPRSKETYLPCNKDHCARLLPPRGLGLRVHVFRAQAAREAGDQPRLFARTRTEAVGSIHAQWPNAARSHPL
jgi:hypothetical protein